MSFNGGVVLHKKNSIQLDSRLDSSNSKRHMRTMHTQRKIPPGKFQRNTLSLTPTHTHPYKRSLMTSTLQGHCVCYLFLSLKRFIVYISCLNIAHTLVQKKEGKSEARICRIHLQTPTHADPRHSRHNFIIPLLRP